MSLQGPFHSRSPQGLRRRIMSSFSDLKKASRPWPRRTLRTSVMAYAWPLTRPHERRLSKSAAVTAYKRARCSEVCRWGSTPPPMGQGSSKGFKAQGYSRRSKSSCTGSGDCQMLKNLVSRLLKSSLSPTPIQLHRKQQCYTARSFLFSRRQFINKSLA